MKIYHTETQADYDALVAELEVQGCKWSSDIKLSAINNWHTNGRQTCLRVYGSEVNRASLNYYKEEYTDIPIIKYKAKADEKMRFTKENVMDLFDTWLEEQGSTRSDLGEKINALVDEPEKVVVPKFVADWIDWNKVNGVSLRDILICYKPFCENADSIVSDGGKAVQWFVDNPYKFIQAYENGYTVEPEQLYYIPLPELQTSDGIQQVLSKRDTYFASRPNEKLKQRFTKEELKQVPVSYKPYAKPIEEEEE